jgi:hypothetical protein
VADNSAGKMSFSHFHEDRRFFILFPTFCLLQISRVTENDRQVKSKTRQNHELSSKNRELTQSLKQLHQSYNSSNQVIAEIYVNSSTTKVERPIWVPHGVFNTILYENEFQNPQVFHQHLRFSPECSTLALHVF